MSRPPRLLPWQLPDFDPRDLAVSKAEQKKAVERLQQLGESLLALKPDEISALPLSEVTQDAILTTNRLPTMEARRRQLQLIGKYLRDEDEHALTQHLFDRLPQKTQVNAERWLERLLAADGDSQIADFARQYRATDKHLLGQKRLRVLYAIASGDASGEQTALTALKTYIQQMGLAASR